MEVNKLIVPVVHLNGTGKEQLVEQATKAAYAAQDLLNALADMSPHGRDYYVLGGDAYVLARDQHGERVSKVSSILDELQEIVLGINEQGR